MSKELEKLYERALIKFNQVVLGYSFVTTKEGYFETFDRFKHHMETDKEFYNMVIKELNQNKEDE